MNSYLQATATETPLTVVVTTSSGTQTTSWPVSKPFHLTTDEPILKLVINGIDCSDWVYHQTQIDSDLPFWLWLHQIAGQGWLFR